MNKRKFINYDKAKVEDIIETLSEGNAYVFSLLNKRSPFNLTEEEFYELLRDIDDMNLRGDQIMFAVKKYCNSNLALFTELVYNYSEELAHAVNVFSAKKGILHKAVIAGAETEKEFLSQKEVQALLKEDIPTYFNFIQRVELADCLTQEQVIYLMAENNAYVHGLLEYLRDELDGEEFGDTIDLIDSFNIRGLQLEYLFFDYCSTNFDKFHECLTQKKCINRMINAVNINTAKINGDYCAIDPKNEKIEVLFPKLRPLQKEFYSKQRNLSYKSLSEIEKLDKKPIIEK